MKIKKKLVSELYDVFHVQQITQSTSLEDEVAVDLVHVAAKKISQSHKHEESDTVLLILAGEGKVVVSKKSYAVKAGDRIHIPPGAFHQVITGTKAMRFLSVQTPPILHKEHNKLDLIPE